ncbi:MAG: 2-phosphosulfolactate phosphatase [Planctomycetes bacterium]|nr:2-phosphosulfolactate phosphatase [Planctomycetota bacterium]
MKERILNVHFSPGLVEAAELAGSTVVVIDLLRATTTICQAVAAGAGEVVPFLEVSDALAAAAEAGRSNVILGGERGGSRIEGFDLGNSPSEYTPEVVGGRRVFITTTNGTRALDHARRARRIVVGAIVNLSTVVASVRHEPRVDILCAGTGGNTTHEDLLAAGAMVHQLGSTATERWQTNEAAREACRHWESLVAAANAASRQPSEQLAIELRDTLGGRNLLAIGLEDDLVDCAQIDRLDVAPELDVQTWRIH